MSAETEKNVLVIRPKMVRQAPARFIFHVVNVPLCAILVAAAVCAAKGATAQNARPDAAPTALILGLFAAVSTILVLRFAKWWLSCRGESLTITNRRSVYRRGILAKHTTEVMHEHIRNVQISQGAFQRLLGVGAIGISSAGQSGVEVYISGVSNPSKVKSTIEQFR